MWKYLKTEFDRIKLVQTVYMYNSIQNLLCIYIFIWNC